MGRAGLLALAVWCTGCNLLLGIESPTLYEQVDAMPQPDAAVLAVVKAGNVHGTETANERVPLTHTPQVYWYGGDRFFSRTASAQSEETSFNIPDDIDYYARIHAGADQWAVTRSRTIDLGVWVMGRTGEWVNGTEGTRLDLTGNGLSPAWQATDTPHVVTTTGGTVFALSGHPRHLTPLPAVDSTSVTSGVDWNFHRLLSADAGDKLMLVVHKWGPTATGYHHATVRAAAPMTLASNMAVGQTTTASGNFASNYPTRTVSIDFRRSQFDAMKAQVNPTAQNFTTRVRVRAQPIMMGGDDQPTHGTPELLYFDNNEVTDANLGTVTIMNPYPSGWILVRDVEYGFFVSFMIQGFDYHARGTFRSVVDIDSVGAITGASLGPVRFPTVNGRGAFADGNDVGTEPVVAWMPPAMGTPSCYVVEVWHFTSNNNSFVQSIHVPARLTSVRIPPGVMRSEDWHVFVIRAIEAGGDPETEPYLHRLPYAASAVITNKFSVAGAPF